MLKVYGKQFVLQQTSTPSWKCVLFNVKMLSFFDGL